MKMDLNDTGCEDERRGWNRLTVA